MTNITLRVPDELKKKMDKLEHINWSAVARTAIERQIRNLEILEEFSKDSTLTEEDAIRLVRELNKRMAKHHHNALCTSD